MAQLSEAVRKVIDAPEFATIATVNPDGSPQLSVVWLKTDGDELLISTVEGRAKHRNLLRDPRASVLVFPKDDPYAYIEVRGTTTMTREGGDELINELSLRYTGKDYVENATTPRVVVRLTPAKVHTRGI